MEPAIVTKWEPLLNSLKQTIAQSEETKTIEILETIDRKIDQIADEALISKPIQESLTKIFQEVSVRFSSQSKTYVVCRSIFDSLNTRLPQLFPTPHCFHEKVCLQNDKDKVEKLIFSLHLISNDPKFSANPVCPEQIGDLIKNAEALLWKGYALLKSSGEKDKLKNLSEKILAHIDNLSKEQIGKIYDPVASFVSTIILINLEVILKKETVERILTIKGNEVIWRYLLENIDRDCEKSMTPFSLQKRDLPIIYSILKAYPECVSTYIPFLKKCISEYRADDFRSFYLSFFNFYQSFIRIAQEFTDGEIVEHCKEIVEVKCKKGSVYLRKYQYFILTHTTDVTDDLCKNVSRTQLRTLIKYYLPESENAEDLSIDEILSLSQVGNLLNIEEINQITSKKMEDYLKGLPRNQWGLLTDESFVAIKQLVSKEIPIHLMKKCRLHLWPPEVPRGSPLEKEMYYNKENRAQFTAYMRQIGLNHWVISHFFPNTLDGGGKNTFLFIINSHLAFLLCDLFWIKAQNGYYNHATELLIIVRDTFLAAYQIPTTTSIIEKAKINLNLSQYQNIFPQDLMYLKDLPIGELTLKKYFLSPLEEEAVKVFFPGVKIIYKDATNGTNQ